MAFSGRQRIVACADSRGIFLSNGALIAGNEFQKIFQSGRRTICGITGIVNLPPLPLARAIPAGPGILIGTLVTQMCSREDLADSPRRLLEALRDDLCGPMADVFRKRPLPDGPFIFAAFAMRKEKGGQIDLIELQLGVTTSSTGERLVDEPRLIVHMEGEIPRGPFVFSIGGDCLTKKLEKRANPDLPDGVVLSRIDEIFAAARADSSHFEDRIGGAVDVCAVDAGGFQWLRRKPEPAPAESESASYFLRSMRRLYERFF